MTVAIEAIIERRENYRKKEDLSAMEVISVPCYNLARNIPFNRLTPRVIAI